MTPFIFVKEQDFRCLTLVMLQNCYVIMFVVDVLNINLKIDILNMFLNSIQFFFNLCLT